MNLESLRSRNNAAARKYRATHPGRQAENDARYYANNTDKAKARSKDYKLRDRRRSLLYDAAKRAKARGLEFSLTVENVSWPSVCPVFETTFSYTGVKGTAQDDSPSLDRIDSNRGYTPDNVQVISWIANRIKSNATPEQIMKVAQYMNRGL